MSGKTVIPFCTHEGSGISDTDGKLKQLLPDSTVLEGLAVQGKTAQKNDDAVKQTVKDRLADNCFGDYYTRKGLDYKQREMITFCYIYAQGGCEVQLMGHTKANMRIGNDKNFLIQIISHCIPFIGYPRTINALNVINKAADEL